MTSGARYQRVTTYPVISASALRAKPKSRIFNRSRGDHTTVGNPVCCIFITEVTWWYSAVILHSTNLKFTVLIYSQVSRLKILQWKMSWVMVYRYTQWLTANQSFYCGVPNLRMRTFWVWDLKRAKTTDYKMAIGCCSLLVTIYQKLWHNVTHTCWIKSLLHLGFTNATVWKHPGRLIAHITILSKPVPETHSCSSANIHRYYWNH